jgi:hypothetical protein
MRWDIDGNGVDGIWAVAITDRDGREHYYSQPNAGSSFAASLVGDKWYSSVTDRSPGADRFRDSVLWAYRHPVNGRTLASVAHKRSPITAKIGEHAVELLFASMEWLDEAIKKKRRFGLDGTLGWRVRLEKHLGEYRLVSVERISSAKSPYKKKKRVALPGTEPFQVAGLDCIVTQRHSWSGFIEVGGLVLPTKLTAIRPFGTSVSAIELSSLGVLREGAIAAEVPATWGGQGRHVDSAGDVFVHGLSEKDVVDSLVAAGEKYPRRSERRNRTPLFAGLLLLLSIVAAILVARRQRRNREQT